MENLNLESIVCECSLVEERLNAAFKSSKSNEAKEQLCKTEINALASDDPYLLYKKFVIYSLLCNIDNKMTLKYIAEIADIQQPLVESFSEYYYSKYFSFYKAIIERDIKNMKSNFGLNSNMPLDNAKLYESIADCFAQPSDNRDDNIKFLISYYNTISDKSDDIQYTLDFRIRVIELCRLLGDISNIPYNYLDCAYTARRAGNDYFELYDICNGDVRGALEGSKEQLEAIEKGKKAFETVEHYYTLSESYIQMARDEVEQSKTLQEDFVDMYLDAQYADMDTPEEQDYRIRYEMMHDGI